MAAGDAFSHYTLARYRKIRGDRSAADALYRAVADRLPDCAYGLGVLLKEDGDPEAAEWFRRGWENGRHLDCKIELGKLMAAEGRVAEASAFLMSDIQLGDIAVFGWSQLFDSVREAFDRAAAALDAAGDDEDGVAVVEALEALSEVDRHFADYPGLTTEADALYRRASVLSAQAAKRYAVFLTETGGEESWPPPGTCCVGRTRTGARRPGTCSGSGTSSAANSTTPSAGTSSSPRGGRSRLGGTSASCTCGRVGTTRPSAGSGRSARTTRSRPSSSPGSPRSARVIPSAPTRRTCPACPGCASGPWRGMRAPRTSTRRSSTTGGVRTPATCSAGWSPPRLRETRRPRTRWRGCTPCCVAFRRATCGTARPPRAATPARATTWAGSPRPTATTRRQSAGTYARPTAGPRWISCSRAS